MSRPKLSKTAKVLIVDDDPMVRKAWRHMLNTSGEEFKTALAADGAEAILALSAISFDVVVTDVMMNGMSGLELLDHIKQNKPEIQVIIMTGRAKITDAVYATKLGAFDYITKPFLDVDACINRVRQAARLKQLSDENDALRNGGEDGDRPSILRSQSPVMRPIINQIERVARVDASVLIGGPTGSGKTAMARALHDRSRRRARDFVHVDCATIPAELIEAELFGHAKGAFSGAATEKVGLFEIADGGTIFLDEVGNMPAAMQPKLLRVLNDGVFRPIGKQHDVEVDVRLISATNISLAQAVADGTFREDLYYRLKVVDIQLPSLSERREDIPQLAYTILRRAALRHGSEVCAIDSECLDRLCAHPWRGNIRELANVIERAIIFETREELTIASLPKELRGDCAQAPRATTLVDLVNLDIAWKESVETAEFTVRSAYLRGVLERYDGNITQAARHAGLDRSNFRRHLRRYLPSY